MRYYFAREPKAIPVDKIPTGYQVEESVNGIVSLVKVHPQLILPIELASVEAAVKKHPQGHRYRAAIKKNQIVIYESQGSDLTEIFAHIGWTAPESLGQEFEERYAHYSPIMRFILMVSKDVSLIPNDGVFSAA